MVVVAARGARCGCDDACGEHAPCERGRVGVSAGGGAACRGEGHRVYPGRVGVPVVEGGRHVELEELEELDLEVVELRDLEVRDLGVELVGVHPVVGELGRRDEGRREHALGVLGVDVEDAPLEQEIDVNERQNERLGREGDILCNALHKPMNIRRRDIRQQARRRAGKVEYRLGFAPQLEPLLIEQEPVRLSHDAPELFTLLAIIAHVRKFRGIELHHQPSALNLLLEERVRSPPLFLVLLPLGLRHEPEALRDRLPGSPDQRRLSHYRRARRPVVHVRRVRPRSVAHPAHRGRCARGRQRVVHKLGNVAPRWDGAQGVARGPAGASAQLGEGRRAVLADEERPVRGKVALAAGGRAGPAVGGEAVAPRHLEAETVAGTPPRAQDHGPELADDGGAGAAGGGGEERPAGKRLRAAHCPGVREGALLRFEMGDWPGENDGVGYPVLG